LKFFYLNNLSIKKNLFRPSLDIFDIKINLKPSYCVKAHQKIDICEGTFLPHYREYDANALQKDKYLPVIDFDPVRNYVEELRKSFDEVALFFYDIYGATQIFVLWKPETLQQKELKIQNSKYRLIDSVKNCFILNIEAVVDDFKIIGDELVESITIKNDSSIFK
jgi:U3 small nucleolar RNA-associated protein 22